MAEETKETPKTEAPATEGGKPQGEANGRNNRKPREDQTPIEELFDLTKPIPRVRTVSRTIFPVVAAT